MSFDDSVSAGIHRNPAGMGEFMLFCGAFLFSVYVIIMCLLLPRICLKVRNRKKESPSDDIEDCLIIREWNNDGDNLDDGSMRSTSMRGSDSNSEEVVTIDVGDIRELGNSSSRSNRSNRSSRSNRQKHSTKKTKDKTIDEESGSLTDLEASSLMMTIPKDRNHPHDDNNTTNDGNTNTQRTCRATEAGGGDEDDISFVSKQTGCIICLKGFKKGDYVCESNVSKCGHVFHKECIFEWIQRTNCCPTCRGTFIVTV